MFNYNDTKRIMSVFNFLILLLLAKYTLYEMIFNLENYQFLQVLVQQQSQLRQQQLIPAGQSPIVQQQQPQQATQRELVPGTAPAIIQTPQQLQATGASGTWIPQQAENAGTGRFTETSLLVMNLSVLWRKK
jgi:hypothetical protein